MPQRSCLCAYCLWHYSSSDERGWSTFQSSEFSAPDPTIINVYVSSSHAHVHVHVHAHVHVHMCELPLYLS